VWCCDTLHNSRLEGNVTHITTAARRKAGELEGKRSGIRIVGGKRGKKGERKRKKERKK